MLKNFLACLVLFSSTLVANSPIRALLITGGCCHDYFFQADKLTAGVNEMANVVWTVVHEGNKSTDFKSNIYAMDDWSNNYDVVVHNECFAKVMDHEWTEKVSKSHLKGVPSVVIHCAMHTYREATHDQWREFLGVTSTHHEHQSHKVVENAMPDHVIMKDFPKVWTSPIDELYIIDKVWPNTQVLAYGISDKKETAGQKNPSFWINQYGKSRVFGTTFGHSNETFEDPVFIKTVARGLLWACDKLEENGAIKAEFLPQKSIKK